jgi:hypothetical protein
MSHTEYQLDKLRTEVKDALGVFGECCYHLEAWQARKQAALAEVNRLQSELSTATQSVTSGIVASTDDASA